MIVSVSSDAQHLTDDNSKFTELFNLLITADQSVNITTGFSDVEAGKFMKKKVPFTLNKVKHISGTNPLLLSWIPSNVGTKVTEYKSIVLTQLCNFLANNCEGLTRYPSTTQGFFAGASARK